MPNDHHVSTKDLSLSHLSLNLLIYIYKGYDEEANYLYNCERGEPEKVSQNLNIFEFHIRRERERERERCQEQLRLGC